MKSLFNGLVCMSLLAFAGGCGKDNSSGGSKKYKSGLTNNSKYLNTSSKQVIETLNRWYKGRTDATNIQGVIKVDKVQLGSNTNTQAPECDELDLGLFSIPYCYYSGSVGQVAGTVLSTKSVAIYPNSEYIYKKGNSELNNIFNGSSGQVVQAVSQGNKVYRLFLQKNNVVTTYTLDLNYHSSLNPVEKSVSNDPSKLIITRASCSSPMNGACVGVGYLPY